MTHHLRLCLLFVAVSGSPVWGGDSWPEWRGPNGQGNSTAKNLPLRWSEEENIAWKVQVPGHGWSTPVVADGRVWVTTAIDVPATPAEAERRRRESTNSQPLRISESVSLRAVAVDLETGAPLADIEMLAEDQPQMIHKDNSYATPTPILEDGRLYCHYGPYGMACLEIATGKVIWENRSLRVQHENGPGSSPVLWEDLLIVHCDGIDRQYIVAIHKDTGVEAWRTARTGKLHADPQMRKSYATPLVVDVGGQPQVISPAADWVYGYDPRTGRELWRHSYGQLGFSNSARPVAGHGLIYTITGYFGGKLLALRATDGDSEPEVVWRHAKQVPNVSSPVLVDDELYFVSDKGIATCLDARSGTSHWVERIGKSYWASPIYGDGHIYFFDRDGTTTVVAADKKFQRVAVNKLNGRQLATVAAVDGALVLRTEESLYRISVR